MDTLIKKVAKLFKLEYWMIFYVTWRLL